MRSNAPSFMHLFLFAGQGSLRESQKLALDMAHAPSEEGRERGGGGVKRDPCWLIWVLNTDGILFLRCIASGPRIAKRYEEYAKAQPKAWRVVVEKTLMNHYYAHGFDMNAKRATKAEWTEQNREPARRRRARKEG